MRVQTFLSSEDMNVTYPLAQVNLLKIVFVYMDLLKLSSDSAFVNDLIYDHSLLTINESSNDNVDYFAEYPNNTLERSFSSSSSSLRMKRHVTTENLDITRVSDRILVTSRCWPREYNNGNLGDFSHNVTEDFAQFLNAKYHDNYLIWNIGTPESVISPLLFNHHRIIPYSLPKTQTFSLKTLFHLCHSMMGWLQLSSDNVVLIQCNNGWNRSGLIVSCLLKFCGAVESTFDAMNLFQSRRLKTKSIPINIQESISNTTRYLKYFNDTMVLAGRVPNPTCLNLHQIIISTIPNFDGSGNCFPGLEIFQNNELRLSSQCDSDVYLFKDELNIIFKLNEEIGLLERDITIHIFHTHPQTGQRSTIFSFTFNTAFSHPGVVRLRADDLEMPLKDVSPPSVFLYPGNVCLKSGKARFQENFHVDLILLPTRDSNIATVDYSSTVRNNFAKNLLRLSQLHPIRPNRSLLTPLLQQSYPKFYVKLALQLYNNDIHRAHEFLAKLKNEDFLLDIESGLLDLSMKSKQNRKIIEKEVSIEKNASRCSKTEGNDEVDHDSEQVYTEAKVTSTKVDNEANKTITEGSTKCKESTLFEESQDGSLETKESQVSEESKEFLTLENAKTNVESKEFSTTDIDKTNMSSMLTSESKTNDEAKTSERSRMEKRDSIEVSTITEKPNVKEESKIQTGTDPTSDGHDKCALRPMTETSNSKEPLHFKAPLPSYSGIGIQLDDQLNMPKPPALPNFLNNSKSNSMSSGPPPPPPPPPFPAPSLPKTTLTAPLKPKIKNSLHWNELIVDEEGSENSIWREISEKKFALNTEKFEELFCITADSKSNNKDQKMHNRSSSKGNEVPIVIDIRRANNVGIGLARFNRRFSDFEGICSAVFEESSTLNLDDLFALKSILPTPEECKNLNLIKKSDTLLLQRMGRSEQFLYHVSSKYGFSLSGAIEMKIFQTTSWQDLTLLKQKLDILCAVLDHLKSSVELKVILKAALEIGNLATNEYGKYTAASPHLSRRNSFIGFTLDSLCKLHEVKSVDGKSNLLTFLCASLKQNHPEVLNLPNDERFKDLEIIKSWSSNQLLSEFEELKCSTDRMLLELNDAKDSEFDRFQTDGKKKLLEFKETLMKYEVETINEFKRAWREVEVYFGQGDSRGTGSIEIFEDASKFLSTISQFFKNFELSIKNERETLKRAETASKDTLKSWTSSTSSV